MTTSVIAIDGPAGSGKSTVAIELARRLGRLHVNTGAMYRAFTIKVLRAKLAPDAREAIVRLLDKTTVELRPNANGGAAVLLDGQDVTGEVGAPEVDRLVSPVSLMPEVRTFMVRQQQRLAREYDVVAEGRDVTTVVYPEAEYKFYLDATEAERARRKLKEFHARGEPITLDQVQRDLAERDHRDSTRALSPLTRAEDAIVIDTTNMTPEQVVAHIMSIVER